MFIDLIIETEQTAIWRYFVWIRWRNSTHQSINIRKYNYICGVSPQRSYAFFILEIAFLLSALINLWNLIYNYLTICKWVVYEFCFWNKKQIRNKNGFLGKSSFFCLHYFSFLSLACNQSTNPSYYYAFSSWFNICFFIYPGIRSEKRKVLFSMIGINMCKVKNNHPSNQIFVYF